MKSWEDRKFILLSIFLLFIFIGVPEVISYLCGNQGAWAAGEFINVQRLAFVVPMTCLNGFYHDVYTESLAEALLKAKIGGTVFFWFDIPR